MGIFDYFQFDPSTYNGSMDGGLLSQLAAALQQRGQQDQGPQPTMVTGGAGLMPVPTFGQAPPPTPTMDMSAQARQQLPPPPPNFDGPFSNSRPGTLFDFIGSLTGQNGNPKQAVYNAILAAGGPREVAIAAAENPKVLEQVGPRYLGESFKIVPYGATAITNKGQVLYENQNSDATLDDKTLAAMAQQYRAGDTSVMHNLGRGIQGSQNIVKLRAEIARQNAEQGTTGEGQAIRNAEFFGTKSGQRSLGNRQAAIEVAATELKQVLPIVTAASDRVDRTNYPDLNKIIQAAQSKTGDPNIVAFGSGINTLINLYARAISPTGQPTVNDKEHAREILQIAWSKGQFGAATQMMQQEVDAALAAPALVQQHMRERFIKGQGPINTQTQGSVPQASAGAPPGQSKPSLPKISTPAEAAKLPRGTRFIDPNGIERVVP